MAEPDASQKPIINDEFFLLAKQGGTSDHLQLSEKERQALELYDQLQNIQIRTAVTEAERDYKKKTEKPELIEQQISKARRDLLEAKAAYTLRNQIIENVIITDPSLKAVHAGEHATLPERELLPRITRRDVLSIAQANISSGLQTARSALTSTEAESVGLNNRNKELAAEVLGLAEQVKPRTQIDIQDPRTQAKVEELKEDVKVQRSRYRTMKGVVSSVIAGSGVDWARDEVLRDLVLDAEDIDAM